MITKIQYKDQDEFDIKLRRLGWIKRGMSGSLWQDPNDPHESCFTRPISMARVVAWDRGSEYEYDDLEAAFVESYNNILCNNSLSSNDLLGWLCEFATSKYHKNTPQVKMIAQQMIDMADDSLLQLNVSDYENIKEVVLNGN